MTILPQEVCSKATTYLGRVETILLSERMLESLIEEGSLLEKNWPM